MSDTDSIPRQVGHSDVILDSIADGVFTVDLDWNITSFNRAAERITGISRAQAIGQKCFDVFRASICQSACALRQTMDEGREIIDLKTNILGGDGRTIPISISTAVLRDESGQLVGGVETFRDLSAIEALRKEITEKYTFEDIISKNREIRRIFSVLPDIAQSESTVLIEGPSGSGKELFARAIHNLSARADKPYVVVNCGALPDTLLESELFGHVKGAFTDATHDRQGRFARAEGGTVFLDEIGDISTALQIRLLRVLQEREYEPLGRSSTVKTNVRVIAATNKVLSELVSRGVFRDDLYFRLNVVKIGLPPLRDRREDIPLLVDHFVRNFNLRQGKDITGVSDQVIEILMKHNYPGNVRELENIIEHAFVLCRGGEIEVEHLPREIQAGAPQETAPTQQHPAPGPVGNPLKQAEAAAILEALRRHRGHRRRAAEDLGIDKTTLWRKMKKLHIEYP
jgi:PAS domain S-box-containing protein